MLCNNRPISLEQSQAVFAHTSTVSILEIVEIFGNPEQLNCQGILDSSNFINLDFF